MDEFFNIAVMLGGPSAERDVSLRSGKAVAQALRSVGHTVSEIDPRPGEWTLPEATDVVFLVLHGTYGEDGAIQAELDQLGVAYTGCDAEASRLAFDKVLSKERFVRDGVPTAPFTALKTVVDWSELEENFSLPVVLKPVKQGSSVGLQFVETEAEFAGKLASALEHDDTVLLEPRIVGREVTVGILADGPLPIVEICPKQGSYDYANKYTVGATDYFCPADLSPQLTARIQDSAMRAFRALGGRDYARVDLMVPESGEAVVLEVNTLPGMTETSLLPKAAAAAGIDYPRLCDRMVRLALSRRPVTV